MEDKINSEITSITLNKGKTKIILYKDKLHIDSPDSLPFDVKLTPQLSLEIAEASNPFFGLGKLKLYETSSLRADFKYQSTDLANIQQFKEKFEAQISLFKKITVSTASNLNTTKVVEINIPEHVILEANSSAVIITRKGLRSFANRGSNGIQTIPYKSIISVDYKPADGPAGLMSGHINFVTAAGNQNTSGIGSLGMFAGGDYNTANSVVFRGHNAEIEEIKNIVEQKIKDSSESTQVISSADEIAKFKKLLDDGTITQEEFDAKKKQLLGL